MKDWEKTILPDFHSLLFPDIDLTQSELQQPLTFRDGKYRFAEVTLPDGWESSINYENFGDVVVITTSVSCMDTISSIIAPLQ